MNWADITDIKPSNDISIKKQESLLFNKLYNNNSNNLDKKTSYSKIVKKELNFPENLTTSTLNYSKIFPNNIYNNNIDLTKQDNMSIGQDLKKKCKETKKDTSSPKKKRNNYCYTCKPRGKVQKHIIEQSELKQVVFHFDLHKRPIILVTPINHYNTIYEIPELEIISLFKAIKNFCDEWNIIDYQVSYNNGKWQTHSHFHN